MVRFTDDILAGISSRAGSAAFHRRMGESYNVPSKLETTLLEASDANFKDGKRTGYLGSSVLYISLMAAAATLACGGNPTSPTNPTPPTPTGSAPIMFNGQPTGTLSAGTRDTTLGLSTDKMAICRYGPDNIPYDQMPSTFETDMPNGAMMHSSPFRNLADGLSYRIYVLCKSGDVVSPTPMAISFSVAPPQPSIGVKLVNRENPSQVFSIDSVLVDGVSKNIKSVGDGVYNIENVTDGQHKLTIRSSAIAKERALTSTFHNGVTYTFNTNPSDFPLNMFDSTARNYNNGPTSRATYPNGTVKWGAVPTFYVDKESFSNVFGPIRIGTDQFYNGIETDVYTNLNKISNNFFNGARIVYVEKSSNMPIAGTLGAWTIRAVTVTTNEFAALHDEYYQGNNLISENIFVSQKAGPCNVTADMMQGVGFPIDPIGGPHGVLIIPDNLDSRYCVPSQLFARLGSYLYDSSRPPGTLSADDTSAFMTDMSAVSSRTSLANSINKALGQILPQNPAGSYQNEFPRENPQVDPRRNYNLTPDRRQEIREQIRR